MFTSLIISLSIFLLYLAGMIFLFGIPSSISETFYLLSNQRINMFGREFCPKWLFTFFCWGLGFTLLPPWLDMTTDSLQFMCFLSAAGLLFVGAAPLFKLKLEGKVHFTSAAVCVVFSQLWVAFTPVWWVLLPIWIGVGLYLLYRTLIHSDIFRGYIRFKESKPMFWVEVAAFGTTYLTIFLNK